VIANAGFHVDETEKANDQETTGVSKPRPWWGRFISLFLKHLLPLLILGFLCAIWAVDWGAIGSPDFPYLISVTSIFMAILVLVLPLSTRGSLESLTCLLLAVEGGILFLAYGYSWSVAWTRVALLQLLVAGVLLCWLTILRIRNRKFSTWLVLTELLTLTLFALLIYFRCTYWRA
jgi:hypothetical protein